MADDVKFKFCPAHNGELLPAVGATGIGLTTTATVPTALVHPEVVAVTEYVPAPALVILPILGFWLVEVKPLGPVQLKADPVFVAVKFKV
jgi:hypothetical protein